MPQAHTLRSHNELASVNQSVMKWHRPYDLVRVRMHTPKLFASYPVLNGSDRPPPRVWDDE